MLAIQRPRTMGSTQPPDVNLPYGLSYDPPHEFLFLDPPEPAPGAPLLSDNETKLLSSFFEDVTSDNYNTTSFGEGLHFTDDWLNLPPQFMGTATSFGQTTPLESPQGLPGPVYHDLMPPPPASMMPPPPPHPAHNAPVEQQASAEVLAAATLLQSGSISRSNPRNQESMFVPRDMVPSLGPPVGHLRHQPLAEFRQDERRTSHNQAIEDENFFTDMVFGSNRHSPRLARPPDLPRWGSDSNFGRAGFTPPSEKETREALESDVLKYVGCLEVSKSAATTRPSSPVLNGDRSPLKLKTKTPATSQVKDEDPDAPPRKRRKSKAKDDTEGSEEEQPSSTSSRSAAAARKRRSKTDGLSTPSVVASTASETSGSRRRKSGLNGGAQPKPPRENLSEEQKRENHIKSEQKRRSLIREGFDDLCDLVPGLRGGGVSKSTMLAMAGEWLEELLRGNEKLREQLAEMGIDQ